MSTERCDREDELLDALGRDFVGAELEAHLAGCASCSELRLVADALLDDRAVAMAEAEVPSGGAMLWRIRIRTRREAEARARRSLLVGHAATLLIAVALVVAFFGADLVAAGRQLLAAAGLSTPFLIGAAMWIVIAPLMGWVAVRFSGAPRRAR